MNPMSKSLAGVAACLVAAAALLGSAHASAEYDPFAARRAAPPPPADRVIVKLRDVGAVASGKPASVATNPAARLDALGRRAGLKPRATRALAPRMALLELETAAGETVAAAIARLRADPEVEFAEPDARMQPHRVPNDPGYAEQWFLQPSAAGPDGTTASAIDATTAWELTTGDPGVVVAVLDTGVRFDHPDLGRVADGGKLLPGYDFVGTESGGTARAANDGDGWDPDPSDPGDWVSSADRDRSQFSGCPVEDSSWHGTRVSGIVAGLTDNATGIAGVGWNVRVLPVRVLGKCGGFTSDIITGMRWAAGLAVDGVPSNPTPARILNLSLGGQGDCSGAYQSAIDEITARGAMVIASAGNDGSTVDQPANCRGVVSVTGVRHVGTKVGFSNLGPGVTISAPGGNCVNVAAGAPCLYSLDTTTNLGTTTPGLNGYTDRVSNINVGTSFASPIVAGIAALMHSVNAQLSAEQTAARLRATASPFPLDPGVPTCHVPVDSSDTQLAECNCTTETCGAGLADAAGAVADARRPIATVAAPSAVDAGATVVLDGAGSVGANGRTVSSYAWTLVSGATSLSAESGNRTTFVSPGASDTVVVRLTVTDDLGLTDSADATISVAGGTTAPAPTPVPTPPADTIGKVSGGGGGGAIDPQALLLLLALSGAGRRALREGER
jgi:serine protease